MADDELTERRALKAARTGGEASWPLLPSEELEARGEHLRPGVRKAVNDLSMVDQVLRFWTEGGCTETGGAHVPDHLVPRLAQALIAGLGVLEQRDGGLSRSDRELALWVADLRRSDDGHSPARVEPDDERIGTAEAAELLGCSQHKVTVLVRKRWLDAQRVGRVWVLKRRQVVGLAERSGDDDRD
ncbi:MAG TPA: helix-turn-helix domain-containing protein [Streptosporangiaceae bacterium]|jgi:excisionase family DNA binding protein